MEWWSYAAIFAVGVVASFVGSIGGGGGMISIPFLILLGVPPQVAIASNKVGGFGMAATALLNYGKAGKVRKDLLLPLTVLAAIASVLGSQILIRIPREHIETVTGILLLFTLPTLLLSKEGVKPKEMSRRTRLLGFVAYFLLNIWQAFFGAGAAVVAFLVMIFCFGTTAIEASATHRLPTLVSNTISIAFFATAGLIDWKIGLVLLMAMIVGANLGSSQALKRGEKFVKLFMAADCVLSSLKLLF